MKNLLLIAVITVTAILVASCSNTHRPETSLKLIVLGTHDMKFLENEAENWDELMKEVQLITQTSVNSQVKFSFWLKNMALSSEQITHVDLSFQLVEPNGSIAFREEKYAEIRAFSPHNSGNVLRDVIPGGETINVNWEAGDPLGKYQMIVTAEDLVAQKVVTTHYSISLVEQ